MRLLPRTSINLGNDYPPAEGRKRSRGRAHVALMERSRALVRPTRMRLALLLIAAPLAFTATPYAAAPANASCVGPMIGGSSVVLDRASAETVRGRYFQKGCADVGICTEDGCTYEETSPRKHVHLRITQDGQRWLLDTEDANKHNRVTWHFRLPAGIDPGRATLHAPGAQPVVVQVR